MKVELHSKHFDQFPGNNFFYVTYNLSTWLFQIQYENEMYAALTNIQ